MSSYVGSGSGASPHSASASRWTRRSAAGSLARWYRAKDIAPEVVSWPAIRKVMTWLRMLAASSVVPSAGWRAVSISPSRSPAALWSVPVRAAMTSSTTPAR